MGCFVLLQQRNLWCFCFAHRLIQVLEGISWMIYAGGYSYCYCCFSRNLSLMWIRSVDFIACHCHQIIQCHLLRSIRNNPLENDYTRWMNKTPINRISRHLKVQRMLKYNRTRKRLIFRVKKERQMPKITHIFESLNKKVI